MVTRVPDILCSASISFRKRSSSVMSASSWFVTWGMSSQDRCSRSPVIFLILFNLTVSNSPNLEKSTSGIGGGPNDWPTTCVGRSVNAPLMYFTTSSLRIRAFGPVPRICDKSAPNSLAKRRTDGLACGVLPLDRSTGGGNEGGSDGRFVLSSVGTDGSLSSCSGVDLSVSFFSIC